MGYYNRDIDADDIYDDYYEDDYYYPHKEVVEPSYYDELDDWDEDDYEDND